jgi:hypothetical protein
MDAGGGFGTTRCRRVGSAQMGRTGLSKPLWPVNSPRTALVRGEGAACLPREVNERLLWPETAPGVSIPEMIGLRPFPGEPFFSVPRKRV